MRKPFAVQGVVAFILCLGMFLVGPALADLELLRMHMVKMQLERRGIKDPKVLTVMQKVARHLFVPEQYMEKAYSDHPLPIGEGQTISQPYIVAFMTEVLKLKRTDRVLEIGTGSGYQAAVLAELCDQVYSIEIVESLGERAKTLLDDLGYENVHVKIGDGYQGWAEFAPFDAIIATCSPTQIPQPLQDQLAEGGRMIIPVGERNAQALVLLQKQNDQLKREDVLDVRFVPMVDSTGTVY